MRAAHCAVVAIERLGEEAANDVDEREEAGEESGGVTERDADDVGREPEIGVEDGAHHFHRVAAQREVMRDEQGDETDHGCGRAADSIAEKTLEENAKQDRAPADEDRGGIEIRDRRPAFEYLRDKPQRVKKKNHKKNSAKA